MLKAVYEGVVFSHMIQIEYLFDGRERPSVFRIAGGATSSAAWIHMFADALGATVEIIPTKEMGTKGVAIASSVACGIYDSIETAIQVMEDGVTRIEPDFENMHCIRSVMPALRNSYNGRNDKGEDIYEITGCIGLFQTGGCDCTDVQNTSFRRYCRDRHAARAE